MLIYTLMNLIKSPLRSFQLFISCFTVFMLILLASSFRESMSKSLSSSGDEKNVIILGTGSEESLERSEVHKTAISAVKTITGLKQTFDRRAVSPEIHFNALLKIASIEKEAIVRGVYLSALDVYPDLQIIEGEFPNSEK